MWFPVVGNVFQVPLHQRWVSFSVSSVVPLCYSDLLCQCVPGLVVQDPVPTFVGLLLGLMKLLCNKPEFVLVLYKQKVLVGTMSLQKLMQDVTVAVRSSRDAAAASETPRSVQSEQPCNSSYSLIGPNPHSLDKRLSRFLPSLMVTKDGS